MKVDSETIIRKAIQGAGQFNSASPAWAALSRAVRIGVDTGLEIAKAEREDQSGLTDWAEAFWHCLAQQCAYRVFEREADITRGIANALGSVLGKPTVESLPIRPKPGASEVVESVKRKFTDKSAEDWEAVQRGAPTTIEKDRAKFFAWLDSLLGIEPPRGPSLAELRETADWTENEMAVILYCSAGNSELNQLRDVERGVMDLTSWTLARYATACRCSEDEIRAAWEESKRRREAGETKSGNAK